MAAALGRTIILSVGLLLVAACSLFGEPKPESVAETYKTPSGEIITCHREPTNTYTGKLSAEVQADVYKFAQILKASASLEKKVELIRDELPGTQTAQIFSHRLCVMYANGIINKTEYVEFQKDILSKLSSVGVPKVSIHRVADFTQSGCSQDGKPIDIAIFDDTVKFVSGSAEVYPAFAREDGRAQVEVFDLNADTLNSVQGNRVPINDTVHKTFLVTIDPNRTAKIRYVWKNAHAGADANGIAITSKYYLSKASAQINVPDGVHVTPIGFEPNGIACVRRNTQSFECPELNNPEAIVYQFRWNMWANCRSS